MSLAKWVPFPISHPRARTRAFTMRDLKTLPCFSTRETSQRGFAKTLEMQLATAFLVPAILPVKVESGTKFSIIATLIASFTCVVAAQLSA